MKNLKNFFCIIGMSVVFSVMIKVPVSAEVDIDYSGVVSDYNGDNPNAQTDQSKMEVNLKEGVSYNGEQGCFLYSISGITEKISSNVMDGMVVQEPVSIDTGEKLKIVLRRNGKEVDTDDLSAISDVGNYIVQARNGSGNMENIFSFTIVGNETNSLMEYVMPRNFAIKSVMFNDEEINTASNVVDFKEEGEYIIEYQCIRNMMSYTLDVIIDRTPPVLKLEGVKNGKISGPVSLADLEQGATISGTLDGEKINLEGKSKLTRSGRYKIDVYDMAGNSSTYEFTILIYLNSTSFVFIGLLILVVAGVAIYIVISRKKLKVR